MARHCNPRQDRSKSSPSRRDFLRSAAGLGAAASLAGAFGFPTIIPSSALGKDGAVAASNRLALGVIGTGGRGVGDMSELMEEPETVVVGLCDVDQHHLAEPEHLVKRKYGENHDVKLTTDWRELCDRKDIDIVQVTTPDHWHALAAITALNAGKDVYCEKPLANSIYESRKIVDAVKKNDRILQVGSQERSNPKCRYAAELVLNGRIGKLHTIRVHLPTNEQHHKVVQGMKNVPPAEPVPEGFDFDRWLGHTRVVPYTHWRTHFFWRFVLDYGSGEMGDRGAHVIDIAQMGNGTDLTAPIEIRGHGDQNRRSLFDAFWNMNFTNKYANGVTLIGDAREPRGIGFEGDKGWIFVHIHGGALEASNPKILQETIGENEINLGRTPNHKRNFLDAVKSRQQPFANAEVGHHTATCCHLNNIAMLTGKKIVWDPKAERITNDGSLNRYVKGIVPFFRPPYLV
jgi:predicted dehydrogenase